MTDELSIEERLARLEENQERRLAIVEELDFMLTKTDDRIRHLAEQVTALDAIQNKVVPAVVALDIEQNRANTVMDQMEAEQRRMNTALEELRTQTDDLIQISHIQGTSVAKLWGEFRKGKGSGNGDSAGKDVK